MSHIKNERYKDGLYSSNHPFIVAIVWFGFDYNNFISSSNAVEVRKDLYMTDEDYYMTDEDHYMTDEDHYITDEDYYMTIKEGTHLYD